MNYALRLLMNALRIEREESPIKKQNKSRIKELVKAIEKLKAK
jgi:hypothetical protein